MDLDFLFFPGSSAPMKPLKDGEIIWLPVNESFDDMDEIPTEELMQEDNSVLAKIEGINSMNSIQKASKSLIFDKIDSTSFTLKTELDDCEIDTQSDAETHHYNYDNKQEGKISSIQNQLGINMSRKNYKFSQDPQNKDDIPCLYLSSKIASAQLLVYFHGNAEDFTHSYDMLNHLRNNLQVNILAVEYPGYGLLKNKKTDLSLVLKNALQVYDCLTNKYNFCQENIIILGRSIGSGPATYVASRRNPGVLVLISAFSSQRKIVTDIAGRLLQYLVKERLNNLENIKNVKCPVFLLHGEKDRLIPRTHSEELYEACKNYAEIVIPLIMDHVSFDFYFDLSRPLKQFLQKINFLQKDCQYFQLKFPPQQREPISLEGCNLTTM